MKTDLVRIILADNNRLFIDSLRTVIEHMSQRLKIVDAAQDSSDVLKKIKKEQPDLILIDINLPGIDGPQFIKAIRSESPRTRIVILTTNTDSHCIEESLKNEVSGYLLKDMALSELITVLPVISDETTILSRKLIPLFLGHTASFINGNKKDDNSRHLLSLFSSHEKKILNLIIQGLSNREIAEKMYLAEQTVKNYVSIIYVKLGVHKRAQAISKGKSLFTQ